ncbi:MAG: hypothetical protein BHW65_09455 [Verrucomicrobia bacterium CAG:312_58_20]|nr:MAG: hypothetical protein BHW65_09455 [Verrucomicrobia bacterium CAG:312_58_20]
MDPNTYYFNNSRQNLNLADSWRLSDGSEVSANVSSSTNIIFDQIWWLNYYTMPIVKSVTVNASGGTFNLNGDTWVGSVEDTVLNFSDTDVNRRGLVISQCGNNEGNNGFKVGGNLVFNSSNYMNVVMACQKDYNMETGESAHTGSYYFNVGGQLQFNHSGDSGFIRFTMSEASGGDLWPSGTGYTKFNPHVVGNIGGLSGRGVFSATKWLSTTVDINFVSNSEGVFQGGVWTGAFTRSSTEDYSSDSSEQWQREVYQNSIGSTASVAFVMDSGNRSVKQTVNLQSAKTFFGDSTSETDIESFTVEVRSGNLEFNSELAIDKVTLAGDNALLKFTSAQKVGEFVIDAGALAFGGKITAGDFTVAAVSADIIFTAADLAAHEIVVVEFDYLSNDFDPNEVFTAYDENGNEIGGEFSLTGGMGESGSLVFTVPEPAAYAAALGALALFIAVRRRK